MAPTCRSRAEAAALLVLVLTTTSGVARAVTPRAPAALLVLVLTTMSGCCMGRGQFRPCLVPKKFCKIFQILRHIESLDACMEY